MSSTHETDRSDGVVTEDPPDAPQKTTRPITHYRGAAFGSWYANAVSVGVTPWDVQCVFGRLETNDAHEIVIEDLVSITLSPPQAKALLRVLAGQVDAYEHQFGRIQDIR